MTLAQPWHHEIGAAGSRYRINTPALILDLDQLERNLAAMATAMDSTGKMLRPHIKSHKCSRIAKLQIDHGAVGICCATLDEAEVMADHSLSGIVITSPVTTSEKIARLTALVAHAADTAVVVDHLQNLSDLADAAERARLVINILVDVELGFGRTGVTTPDAAIALARAVQAKPALSFAGLQAYGGHLQHILSASERAAATCQAGAYIGKIRDEVRKAGLSPAIVTGGGTGTHAIDGAGDWFTEIQAGSYPLMDADYGAVAYREGEGWPFHPALFVQAAVVSANIPGTVTVDSGTKAIATNGPAPQIVSDDLTGATFEFTGDEHGRIRLPPTVQAPKIGQRIELIVSHCDPTVAMHDTYHCIRGDRLVDIWSIDARGRR